MDDLPRCFEGSARADRMVERVARAIYMTHWELPLDSERGLDPHIPPTWETVSNNVRQWVRAQAISAIAAMDEAGEAAQ